MKDWSVYLQAAHNLDQARIADVADELVDVLKRHGGSVSFDAQMLAGSFDVRASDPEIALVKASRIFGVSLRKAGFPGDPVIIAAQVETVEELDRSLQESNVPPSSGSLRSPTSLASRGSGSLSSLGSLRSLARWLTSQQVLCGIDLPFARFLERWPRRRTGRPKRMQHAPNFGERPGR